MNARRFSLGAVVLAAGRSTRMGTPKLLLPWGGTSILGHLIMEWTELGADQIAVVSELKAPVIGQELDRIGFPQQNRIDNPQPEGSMFSSIICAAKWPHWQATLSHFAIVLGDQPHLRRGTLRPLLKFAEHHPGSVCQPAQNGRKAHPVLLPRALFFEIADSKSTNLKEFLAGRPSAECECEDPGLDLDVDRPEDYQKALSLAGLA